MSPRTPIAGPQRSRRSLLVGVLSLALVAVVLVVPTPPRAAAATTPAGAVALGNGASGQVDLRTGTFSLTAPLADVTGAGDAGIRLALSWQQERATGQIDRSGWGAGWSLGTSFISTNGLKRVYPAAGGSYALDPTNLPSGLKNYKLKDLTFTQLASPGTLRARPGATAISYSYTIGYDDGRTDYFDVNGNLVARIDRFGNRTDLRWQPAGTNRWRPTTIVSTYGLATTFGYPSASKVTVSSPERSDGVTPVTAITLGDTNPPTSTYVVRSISDPAGNVTSFGLGGVTGSAQPLVTSVTAATGARTVVTYQNPAYQNTLVAVHTVNVTDGANAQLSPTQTFSLNPTLPGGAQNNEHNYTGYPLYQPANGSDPLFDSGNQTYTYTTGLTIGTVTTLSTYDALHRLAKRQLTVPSATGPLLVQTHAMSYDVPVQVPVNLPANYAKSTAVAHTSSAATGPAGVSPSSARTTTVATTYDDHGRVLTSTDESGAVTSTTYGAYGLVTAKTTTGRDGSVAQTTTTPIGSGSAVNIGTSTTLVGQAGQTPTARQVIGYTYDDSGQVKTRTLSWAPGAKPDFAAGGGPDTILTSYDRVLSSDGRSLTLTTTVGAGTSDAQVTTSTVDTVSGKTTRQVDALGRAATFGYDAIGRETSRALPSGLTTTTAYTPTTTTKTDPDGRITRTTTDLLGRLTTITDNVSNGAFTTNPASRTLSAQSYSADGSTITATDQRGRVSTTSVDVLGRPVRQVGATGVSRLTSYDDGAAHTTAASIVPDDATAVQRTKTTSLDDLGRSLGSTTSFPASGQPTNRQSRIGAAARVGLPADLETSTAYNDLGQADSSDADDLSLETAFSGPGGVAGSTTATPGDTSNFPGAAMTATTERSLSGAPVSRTLSQGGQTSAGVAYTYNAAGKIVTATDPNGAETAYTYTDDGQPETKTTPSGAVTIWTYAAGTGLVTSVAVTAPGKPTRTITYTRVPAGRPGAGMIATISDGTDTITYGYDVDRHRTSVSYPDGTSTAAAYNDKGQLTSTTDVTGAVTSFGYDPVEGSLLTATQRRGTTLLASVTYRYDTLDRVRQTVRGNGITTTNTYTADNRLALQSTTGANNQVLESHAYTYDDHGNVATKQDTNLAGGSAAVPGGGNVWSTVYSYDAYNRLIGSAVYAGALTNGQPTGTALTQTAYTVDLGSDVTQTKTTYRTTGPRPSAKTTTTTNTIDDAGRLTGQTTGANTASQTFDGDGRVLTTLDRQTWTYTADGAPASAATANGSRTTYARWPDGRLRSAATTAADGTTSTVSYHYGTDGVLVNDATADTSTGSTSAVASYLQGAAREARTLSAGSTAITTGSGTGYFVRDRHSNVVGLIDSAGSVTATYGYADYGAPARADGRPASIATADGGRSNPYRYVGATPHGAATDLVAGRVLFQQRVYDASTGRFASADPVDAHNRYQGFRANPVNYADLGGGIAVFDAVMDSLFAVIFIATAFLTFGTGVVPAVAALAAAEAAEVTAGAVVSTVSAVISTAANLTGAATSAMLATDDIYTLFHKDGKSLFSTKLRDQVTMVNTAASVLAGASGFVQGATADSIGALKETIAARTAAVAAQPPVVPVAVNNVGPPPDLPPFPERLRPPARLAVPIPEAPPPPDGLGVPAASESSVDSSVEGSIESSEDVVDEAQVAHQEPRVEGIDPVVRAEPQPVTQVEQEASVNAEEEPGLRVNRDVVISSSNEVQEQVRQHLDGLNEVREPVVVVDQVAALGSQPVDPVVDSASSPLVNSGFAASGPLDNSNAVD